MSLEYTPVELLEYSWTGLIISTSSRNPIW